MNFHEALAATDSTTHIPPVRLKLYARRQSNGTTLIFGGTAGYTLPDGINDAEITIPADAIRFHTDRTAAFRGHSYMSIIQDGPGIIQQHEAHEAKKTPQP